MSVGAVGFGRMWKGCGNEYGDRWPEEAREKDRMINRKKHGSASRNRRLRENVEGMSG
jgi:hypothetical protein